MASMEACSGREEGRSSAAAAAGAGYGRGPPWVFRGRALYQLHLVKAATARAFVPKELRLVEAFGYTLGGMFLARYDDSPAGKFDELVVIAGIVWNPPTSCAWAARVLVNSAEACRHGRKVTPGSHLCGQIEDHPDLLKYSCQVECRVRPVRPAKIWRPRIAEPQECPDGKISSKGSEVLAEPDAQKHTVMVLLSKPILALEFNSLEMLVDAPKIVVPHSKKKEVRYSST